MSSSIPLSCTLSRGALEERTARFATLNRTALRSAARGPRTLTLRYSAAADAELRELVRLERECCAFLGFQLVPEGTIAVALHIEAPDMDGAEHLLAPFLEAVAPEYLPPHGTVAAPHRRA